VRLLLPSSLTQPPDGSLYTNHRNNGDKEGAARQITQRGTRKRATPNRSSSTTPRGAPKLFYRYVKFQCVILHICKIYMSNFLHICKKFTLLCYNTKKGRPIVDGLFFIFGHNRQGSRPMPSCATSKLCSHKNSPVATFLLA